MTSLAHMLHFDVTEQETENRVRRVSGEEEEEEEGEQQTSMSSVSRRGGWSRPRAPCMFYGLPPRPRSAVLGWRLASNAVATRIKAAHGLKVAGEGGAAAIW